MSGVLGLGVQANRINVQLGDDQRIIVAQYRGPRLPEGATQLPEGATLEFYRVMPVDIEAFRSAVRTMRYGNGDDTPPPGSWLND